MASTIYKYRVWCESDQQWEHVWAEVAPTVCPSNSSHSIDASKTTIVDEVTENTVTVREENTPTGGHYQAVGIELNIPSGIGWTNTDISFPHPISLMAAEWTNKPIVEGDEIEFVIAPDTVVGTITQEVPAGSGTLHVSSTVLSNMFIGCRCALYDGVNKDDCGRVVAINTINETITVETPAQHSFAAGSPTYVMMWANMVRPTCLAGEGRIQLGEAKIGGSHIASNTTLRARYKNNSGEAKSLVFWLEYLY